MTIRGIGVVINNGYPTFFPDDSVERALEYAQIVATKGDEVVLLSGLQTDNKILWCDSPLMEFVVSSWWVLDNLDVDCSGQYATD